MAEALHGAAAPLWGVAAEFDSEDALLAALRALRDRDLGRLDAYSPMPIPHLSETLRLRRRQIYGAGGAAAAIGGLAMFGMCTYATVYDYRFLIGGRPLFSWPSFIIPSVSFAVLLAALVVFGVTMVLSRLPRLNHPAFNIPNFTRASEDRFFVAIEARDEHFDPEQVESAFALLPARPLRVSRVPQ